MATATDRTKPPQGAEISLLSLPCDSIRDGNLRSARALALTRVINPARWLSIALRG